MSKIKNIIIDPGHGGIDENGNYTTAPSKTHKHKDGQIAYEGVLNRNIAKALLKCFQADSLFDRNVYFTVGFDDPEDVPLQNRVNFANRFNPNHTIFISIHCNAGGGSGFEIFTSSGQTKSDNLATKIYESLKPIYHKNKLPLRIDLSDGDFDKEAEFYVLRKTLCPAILLEYGFFDNIKDFELLQDEKFVKDIAFSTFHAIMTFINEQEQ